MPVYLISIKHFTGVDMGKTMSVLGLGAIIWGIVIPALSDKFGRKPIVIICFLPGALMPLGAIYSGKRVASLSPFILLGASVVGCIPGVLVTYHLKQYQANLLPRHWAWLWALVNWWVVL